MEKLSLEKSKVLSLFPKLDENTAVILFYLMKSEKKYGEVLLVEIMENCFLPGTHGMYQINTLLSFFDRKIKMLRELMFGKENRKVFKKLYYDFPKIEWEFSEEFYEEAVL